MSHPSLRRPLLPDRETSRVHRRHPDQRRTVQRTGREHEHQTPSLPAWPTDSSPPTTSSPCACSTGVATARRCQVAEPHDRPTDTDQSGEPFSGAMGRPGPEGHLAQSGSIDRGGRGHARMREPSAAGRNEGAGDRTLELRPSPAGVHAGCSATAFTFSRVRSMSRWFRRSRRNPPRGRQTLVKKLSPRSKDSMTSVPPSSVALNS